MGGVSAWLPLAEVSAAVDAEDFLVVVTVAAIAGTAAALLGGRGVLVPVVVIELLLGVVIGPQVLGLDTSEFLEFFSSLGLGMLFFFAGYELDLGRIAGHPLRLAALGWAMSLALAYTIGGVLAATGVVLSLLYTGSALATTAIGTLLPVLSDTGQLRSRFGTYLLAGGAVGEFGPILLITMFLSAQSTWHNTLILIAFVAVAVGVAVLAVRSSERTLPMLERTMDMSSQLAVRWIVVLVFALAALAAELGLDLLLGGFAAGVITRQVLKEREVVGFEAKLTAVAFGVFIPFFFVVRGMQLDVAALFSSVASVAKMLLFFLLFLVVRGVPALVLYRGVLNGRQRISLAFFQATQLPLVLAITTLAQEGGHMRATTAASLVGAAVLSTLCFPILGLRFSGDAETRPSGDAAGEPQYVPAIPGVGGG
jgi:Kef-type K+ transport system membrane component KefB